MFLYQLCYNFYYLSYLFNSKECWLEKRYFDHFFTDLFSTVKASCGKGKPQAQDTRMRRFLTPE